MGHFPDDFGLGIAVIQRTFYPQKGRLYHNAREAVLLTKKEVKTQTYAHTKQKKKHANQKSSDATPPPPGLP